MTSIDRTTIPIGKAAAVLIFVCGFLISTLGSYYAAKDGVKDGFNEIKLELRDLENENKLQNILISGNQKSIDFNYSLIKELQEAVKPDEPTIKSYRK